MQWRLLGDGLGYVEEDGEGEWRLTTTGPGTIRVEVRVMDALGATATRELTVEVGEED